MISTLISTALGFTVSFIPKLLDFYQDSKDKKHELDVMALQIEREIKLQDSKAQAMMLQAEAMMDAGTYTHDIKIAEKSADWVINMRSSVRPIVTYLFFAIFFFVELVAAYVVFRDGGDIALIVNTLWSESTQNLFAAIIAFWFGSRAVKK